MSNTTTTALQFSGGAFEGPEKLLEVWFEPSPNAIDGEKLGLRLVEEETWANMLKNVKCKILTTITNDYVDAYLLSESSMFVYPHKFILKTCGTTTLLVAIPLLLKIASERCRFHKVWRIFYSRKSFKFPERQSHPHRDWKDEVAYLDKLFDNSSAYTVGKMNGDHWFLYLTSPSYQCHRPDLPSIDYSQHSSDSLAIKDFNDQTVEILMTDLCPAILKNFHYDPSDGNAGTEGGALVDKRTGLCELFPSAQLDSYLFKPCGYSANGLVLDSYFTIHVTPEPECSYASFETNIQVHCGTITDLIQKVINIFKPDRFNVTVFKTWDNCGKGQLVNSLSDIVGYVRKDRILYDLDGYDLIFGHFIKKTNPTLEE